MLFVSVFFPSSFIFPSLLSMLKVLTSFFNDFPTLPLLDLFDSSFAVSSDLFEPYLSLSFEVCVFGEEAVVDVVGVFAADIFEASAGVVAVFEATAGTESAAVVAAGVFMAAATVIAVEAGSEVFEAAAVMGAVDAFEATVVVVAVGVFEA